MSLIFSLILPPFVVLENACQQLAPQSSAVFPHRFRKFGPNLFVFEAQFALPHDRISLLCILTS